MRNWWSRIGVVTCAVATLLLANVPASAQVQTGEISGKVTDGTGAVLPGTTVTVESPALIRPQAVVTAASGGYRISNLPVGTYNVRFELTGFKTQINSDVRVEAGFNAEISPKLQISALEETVTVSGESPVVDTQNVKTGQTFSKEMLDGIPSARDPWVILEQTPGVLMDRQNVGGNQSGQQSSFTVHGGNGGNSMWNVDGVTITDMAATGASPTYYDFDSFEEIQIQTGGNDASLQTGGINLNMITKSGGNRFRGSGRVFIVDEELQSNNISRDLFDDGADSGNPIQNIRDYGMEIGGPLVRNKAWFWGGYGKQNIKVGVLGFYRDDPACQPPPSSFDQLGALKGCLATDLTVLENYNGKLQYQPASAHKFTALYTRGDKIRNARGASPTTRIESTFRQSGPTNLYKGSHQWVLSDRMTVESQYAYTDGGFVLDFHSPELAEVQRLVDLDTGVTSRSGRRAGPFVRPQTEIKSDANYFLSGVLGGDHSMKFGLRWRDTPSSSQSHIGGFATARVDAGRAVEADLHRDSNAHAAMTNFSAYVNDSYHRGRATLTLGLRVDHQDDEALAATLPANPIIPDLLPSVDFSGVDSGVTYTDWSPRAAVTYDLLGTGKTILKGSGAIYYGQGIFTGGILNPTGAITLRYPWNDLNGDLLVQRNELNLGRLLAIGGNYDPANPSALTTPNSVDPGLQNDRTREIIIGVDHELMSNFGVGASFILRNYDRFSWDRYQDVASSDYTAVPFSANCGNDSCSQPSFSTTYFRLPFRLPVARVRTNDPFYRIHHGWEFTARKRMSNRWMMNASLALNNTKGYYDKGSAFSSTQDPTNQEFYNGFQDNSRNARWIAKLSGLYSLPWGVNVAGFLNARDGFPNFLSLRSPDRGNRLGRVNVGFEPYGENRLERMVMFDGRVEKAFIIRDMRATLSLDVFNLGNAATVLDREGRQNVSSANRVFEVLAPRVARFGVRFRF